MCILQDHLGMPVEMRAGSKLVELDGQAGLFLLSLKAGVSLEANPGLGVSLVAFADCSFDIGLGMFLQRLQAGGGNFHFELEHFGLGEKLVARSTGLGGGLGFSSAHALRCNPQGREGPCARHRAVAHARAPRGPETTIQGEAAAELRDAALMKSLRPIP